MSYKSYTWYLVSLVVIMFCSNLIIWEFCGAKKTVDGYALDRLGYFLVEPTQYNPPTIPNQKHIEMPDYILNFQDKKIDVVTIGDSFFNGSGRFFWQDYLSNDYNLTVLNIKPILSNFNALETAIILYNSGYLQRIAPKAVILESVGRLCAPRFGEPINFTESKFIVSTDDINKHYPPDKSKENLDSKNIFDSRMVKTNAGFIISLINYNTNQFKLNRLVYYDILKQPMFSNKTQENLLLYYYEDVENYISKNQVVTLNNNMNNFSAMLKKEKISLMFMIAADKWDLYYNYIEQPKSPPNPLFDYMRELDKDYIFIDTKKILSQELQKDEKDVYWCDDTHWSWKGSLAIANYTGNILQNIEQTPPNGF